MKKLVLIRHGESDWNRQNRFTGWTDVDLSRKGRREAQQAGILLRKEGFTFDRAHTSVLKRAIRTLWSVMNQLDLLWMPVERTWRLNERHYGALQGLNKSETAQKYGEAKVHEWRRSFSTLPPLLDPADLRHPRHDRRYAHLQPSQCPAGESLKETVARVVPYWENALAPSLIAGERPIVVAHGNSLRALMMHLESISEKDITGLNIPTGIPLVYTFDAQLRPVDRTYLGDAAAAEAAAAAVAAQGKK